MRENNLGHTDEDESWATAILLAPLVEGYYIGEEELATDTRTH